MPATEKASLMHDLLTWYVAVEILGLMSLPLAGVVFAGLPDRGWALAKPLAILLLGVGCWLPAMLFPAIPYNRGWIVTVVLLMAAGNVMFATIHPQVAQDLWQFVRRRWVYVASSEAIFAVVMGFMGWLRSFSPQIEGTEKFMDEAFLASIIHTQHLPPPDPWLSGYSINYYYFGHFLLGTLAKLLGTPASVAFNTGIALTAGLVASAVFGVATCLATLIFNAHRHKIEAAESNQTTLAPASNVSPDLLAGTGPSGSANRDEADLHQGDSQEGSQTSMTTQDAGWGLNRAVPFGAFAVMATLVMGNLWSFKLWWSKVGSLGGAWHWLMHPALWTSYDWWTPSRALPRQTITEFPDFSFLLSDLHAHVLALPYAVMAVGFALSFWLAPPAPGHPAAPGHSAAPDLPGRRGLALFGDGWRGVVTVIVAGLAVGGLYLMNGWDLPTYLGLALVILALHQWNAHDRRLSADFGIHIAQVAGVFLVACFIPYLPFYLGFNSPSQGIGIVTGTPDHAAVSVLASDAVQGANLFTRTAIGDELGANGVMLVLLGTWVVILLARQLAQVLRAPAFAPAPVTTVVRVGLASDLPGANIQRMSVVQMPPDTSAMAENAPPPAPQLSVPGAWWRSWGIVGTVLAALVLSTLITARWDGWTLVWMLIGVLAAVWLIASTHLFAAPATSEPEGGAGTGLSGPASDHPAVPDAANTFPLLLVAIGLALIGVCEVIYLRDVFEGYSPRMNTVFKFYFQVWTIFALASAPALAWLVLHLRDRLPGALHLAWQPIAYLWRGAGVAILVVLIAVTLVYPLGAIHTIYFQPGQQSTGTLDGLMTIPASELLPGDERAVAWLRDHTQGSPVIVEAMTGQNSEYSSYFGRVSVFSGLPTIIGWYGHEYQWRVNWLKDPANANVFTQRLNDIQTIYTSNDAQQVLGLLHHYGVQYVYVGPVEEQTYGAGLDPSRFSHYLRTVYNADGVVIFQVPAA